MYHFSDHSEPHRQAEVLQGEESGAVISLQYYLESVILLFSYIISLLAV